MSLRPSLRTVLLLVNLTILLLPVGGLSALRLYDSALIRQTESELIAQGAFVGAAFRDALLHRLQETSRSAYGAAASPRWLTRIDPLEPLHPIAPNLDLAEERVRSRAPSARTPGLPPDPDALAAAEEVLPLLQVAREVTLAAIRVVDFRGTVVATTRSELGLSLAHREEVRRALEGEHVSLLRERISDEPAPPLTSIRRGSRIRVFVATPILDGDRVVGAVVLSRSPMTVDQALFQHRQSLLLAAGMVMGIVLLVSTLTSLTIARPIRSLIGLTERIARGDKAATPLEHPGTFEIAQLSEAFAHMAQTLEARADYIRTFASHVSHEFKTPLTSIRGTVELLRDHLDEMTPAERDRFLQNLDDDADRLSRLVRRLLDLARADVLEPAGERIPVREVLDRLAERRRSNGLELALHHDPGVETVRMAPETFESIVSNLVDNARQHGGEGVRILVRTRNVSRGDKRLVEVEVEDNGPGISPANAHRVFEPFFTTARDRGGTGLGLAIVRSLVSAHGGEITYTPANPGARFTILLPA